MNKRKLLIIGSIILFIIFIILFIVLLTSSFSKGGDGGDKICKKDLDCPLGTVCKNGNCETKSSTCKKDLDCPLGTVCKNGNCETPIIPPAKGNPPKEFRISPVTLRNDNLVNNWLNNGNVPVRLSWISTDHGKPSIFVNGKEVKWQYDKQFECGWTNIKCQTVSTVIREGENTLGVSGVKNWSVYYPKRGEKNNFMMIGDPQISEDSRWGLRDAHYVLNKSINEHIDKISTVIFGGDNFYDADTGQMTEQFWNGSSPTTRGITLSPQFYAKILICIIGNHDYANGGLGDNKPNISAARQYLQYYGIDGYENPFDSGDLKCCTKQTRECYIPQEWTSGCYVVGENGFLTGDNVHKQSDIMGKINYSDISTRFKKLGVKQVFYISHWKVAGLGALETTEQAWNTLKPYFTGFKFNYITNHTHLDQDLGGGNRLTGGNGHMTDCPGINSSCIGASCCCPSYYIDGVWKQGWNGNNAACKQ